MSESYDRVKKEGMKRRSLGRGLSALISSDAGLEDPLTGAPESMRVRISQISTNRFQPRTQFDAESITSLAESIKTRGVIQPLLVRTSDNGGYELVCGERRLRAAKEAGLSEVPVSIRDISDSQALELGLIENLQRKDLNPIDEANGYKVLQAKFNLSAQEIGIAVGKDRATIANTLRLLELDTAVRKWVAAGKISAGHARALLVIDSKLGQRQLAEKIMQEGLSVRQVEDQIYGPGRIIRRQKKRAGKGSPKNSPDLDKITGALEKQLGTKVQIRTGRKGGRIEVHYYSLDDFERILSAMGVDK